MRISQRSVTRNYMRSLNDTLTKKAASLDRGTSGIKFRRLSANVSDGVRAMHLQEQREKYSTNLDTVKSILLEFDSADSNMNSMEAVLQTAQEKLTKAINDSYGDTSREVLAQEIASIKQNLLQFANASFSDKFLFSGTNNYTAPYDFDVDGDVTYNGVKMKMIEKGPDGKYYTDNTFTTLVPHSGDIYMDIGMGVKMQGGEPDPRTALKVSFDGIAMFGFGGHVPGSVHPADGVPNNLFDLLSFAEKSVWDASNPTHTDKNGMDNSLNALIKLTDNLRLTRTELGARTIYLESTQTKLESDIQNLTEAESGLITADPAEESITMKNLEYVWLATLQLGATILPTSLLDFLR